MASIKNPEKFHNFQLTPPINFKNSIPSFRNSEFNPQTQISEKPSDFTAHTTQINFHGRKSNYINFTNLKHYISMILNDAAKNDTNFCGFTNLFFFIFGGTAKSDALLICRFPCAMKNSSFRKLADADQGSGDNLLGQMEMMTIHGDIADSGEGGLDGGSGNGNGGGNSSGNGGNDGGDGDGNGGNGDAVAPPADDCDNNQWWKLWVERIKVHGIALYDDGSTHCSPIIDGDVCACQYDSWLQIGTAMLQFWLEKNNYNLDPIPEIPNGNPNFCCPGSVTLFGRYEGDVFFDFRWQVHEWDDIKLLIKDVMVIRLVEGNWKEVN